MVLSRPSSPSSPLLGQAPKWLRSSRGIGSPKYIFKITALAFLCIALGWSVTSMYDSNEIQQHGSSKALGTSSEMLEADYGMAEPMEDASGYLDHASALANHRFAPGQTHNAGHPKSSSGSLLHTVSHKISAWNPWDKNGGSEDDATLERLLKSGSVQQTEEIVTSARTRTGEKPIMCKVTIITGGENSVYERALKTHNLHNRIHGYPMHTLRQSILNDVWSKPAYILSVMLRELAKPKSQRVQWLFWVDADTIIINPHVPAEIFLPPHGFNDVHLLVSHDFNGLNNGVFPIRVHPWSVELLSAVLAFPIYRPDENLLFRDQSAMGELLKTPKFARHTVQAPQRWFNAYQGEINETIAPFQTRPGDLLVHFAGVPNRDERMEYWLRRVELHLPEWEIEFKHTSYHTETRQFWDELAGARVGIRRKAEEMKSLSEERTETLKKALEKYNTVLNEEQKGRIDKSMEEMKKVFENEDTKENLDAIREAAEKMREVNLPSSVIQILSTNTSNPLKTGHQTPPRPPQQRKQTPPLHRPHRPPLRHKPPPPLRRNLQRHQTRIPESRRNNHALQRDLTPLADTGRGYKHGVGDFAAKGRGV